MAYSEKFKENLLAKALAPSSNVSGLARQAGVSKQTLFAWVRQAKLSSVSDRSKKKRGRPRISSRRSPEEKLRILTESAGLGEDELGAFLRKERALAETALLVVSKKYRAIMGTRTTTRARTTERTHDGNRRSTKKRSAIFCVL